MSDAPTREHLLHLLYEAAELEHNLMCTYLYAAFSLKRGEAEGLTPTEAAAVERWRQTILQISIEEMAHLTAVWNITSALGGAPRFGRGNFPLDPGLLPAGVVVKLAPFNTEVLQHFIHLERPVGSTEREGADFAPAFAFSRGTSARRLTPMAIDYDTVGAFYAELGAGLRAFVALHGETAAFCGDPALQLSPAESRIAGKPVICLKTALAAFAAIVEQGEGAPEHAEDSHFARFVAIRTELAALHAANPAFKPAFPAAHNPVLRRPLRAEGRVWIEDETAAITVDLANTGYALMLRLIAYAYTIPRPSPEKTLVVDLALGLMRAITPIAERAARLPAGPSNPDCNAGMSFTALREAGAVPAGASAARFFIERLAEMTAVSAQLATSRDERATTAHRMLTELAQRATAGFATAQRELAPKAPRVSLPIAPPAPISTDGIDRIEGKDLTLIYEGVKCIHSRHCVTGAPGVFLANVQGPWIHPDAMDVELLAGIAHVCPSGAIRYERKDGHPNEAAPPVNLISVREAGPYAVRGELILNGAPAGFRATLCRCGASKHKPFCDGSHHEVAFAASGEPATGKDTEMLEVRDGPLAIDPQTDGPLQIRGNLEITSGTGRMVARIQEARLCRCGGSSKKPFCDGTHAKIGFKST
ncbi:MAG: CDGSH iron-sulfur domain-containing protein [Myxococcales bacterium]|nr:CDGSH iron-sulfur domain-containing protein [Myxococcales bacterium]